MDRLLLALVLLCPAGAFAQREERLAADWRFARTGSAEGAFLAPDFDDSSWEAVEVPHDWAIAGPFDPNGEGDTGRLPWKGIGVYRRSFTLSEQDLQGCVLLDFDGVMARPKVYVNGRLTGGWDYGYMSFRVDATELARAGTNQLTVVADTRAHRSRWYPGAGMTRKVVLKTRPKVRFAYNGIAVTTPVAERGRAIVKVAWETENANGASVVEVRVGAAREGTSSTVKTVQASVGSVEFELKEPMLWDVTNPVLYRADCTLDGGARESVRFGIRTIGFPVSPDRNAREGNGFYLNGRRVDLKGVNLHEDFGPLGRAYNRSARYRQLLLMKDMGANALRTSHYPVAPETLDLCDELGILVWDECFDKWDDTAGRLPGEDLEPYVARNLRAFVRRDRNHPSVIVWSMGNEMAGYAAEKKGFTESPAGMTRERCARFRAEMLEEDATRPVGNGNMPHMAKPRFFARHLWDDLDITGWNYLGSHDTAKAVYPGMPIVYSEFGSPGSTYGFYCTEPSRTVHSWRAGEEFAAKQMDGYDLGSTIDIADWELERLARSPYCAGGFLWTGIDYLGEPIPYRDDARSSYFGNVDLTGVPKDRFWLFRATWNPAATTVHVLPHWNWPAERIGRKTPVFVYTNGDAAELFVNGRSQGLRRKVECELPGGRTNACYRCCGKYRLMWFDAVYEPGEVKAVAYRNGVRLGEATVRTAGEPVALRLTPEVPDIPADRETLAFVQVDAVDAQGVRYPLATNRVAFALSGPGRIVAVGNGNPRDLKSFKDVSGHDLFFGKATVALRREGEGPLVLTASADGLRAATAALGASAAEVSVAETHGDVNAAVARAVAAGGGRVIVPKGDWPTPSVRLASDVELHLADGARLVASTNRSDYVSLGLPYCEGDLMAVVTAVGATNVAITGRGEIFGNGAAWPQPGDYGGNQEGGRPRGIVFANCRDVRLSDFLLRDSPCWGIVIKNCDGVVARRVRVDSHANANNDGFDIEARNVLVEDCDVDSGDDAFCLKSNDPGFTMENVVIRRCVGRSNCNAFKIGTASHGTVRNVRFEDCRTEAPRRDFAVRLARRRGEPWFHYNRTREWPGGPEELAGMAGIAIECVDGGEVSGVTCTGFDIRGVMVPIFVRGGTRTGRSCGTPPSDRRILRDILIADAKAVAESFVASSVTGVEGCRPANVTLRNVSVLCKGRGAGADVPREVPERPGAYPEANMFRNALPAYGLYVRHADDVRLENTTFALRPGTADARPPVVTDDANAVRTTP